MMYGRECGKGELYQTISSKKKLKGENRLEHISNSIRKGAGRPPLFHDGKLDYRQEVAAILLAHGWGLAIIGDVVGGPISMVRKWKTFKIFKDRIEFYKEEFVEQKKQEITKQTLDTEAGLCDIINRAKNADIKGSDAVQAYKEINRMRGQLAPKELKKTIEYKEAEKMSSEERKELISSINKQYGEEFKRGGGNSSGNKGTKPKTPEGA